MFILQTIFIMQKQIIILIAFWIMAIPAFTQDKDTIPVKKEHKITFKDSLDGAFDVSDFLINIHGFLPVPTLVTEPALGGIGGFLGLVFMQPPKERVTFNKRGHPAPVRPTITGIGGFYTANKSWGLGGGYTSEWEKYGITYSAATAYANVNMDFYKELPTLNKELKASLNFETVPFFLSVRKSFLGNFAAGFKYMFAYAHISLNTEKDWDSYKYFNELLEKMNTTNIVSRISPVLVYDSRDNMFSPNNGLRIDAQLDWSDKALGSDFDYVQLNMNAFGYKELFDRWVASLRLEWEQIFEDPAFYMLPYVSLRGVPANRYQGNIIALAETEHRVTVYKRWAVVGFAGVGKAFDSYDSFDTSKWIYNYGGGFRYLIARKFKLQMGADLGFGPNDWGAYIIFGSGWMRD